jgi:hypothetical protein
MRPTGRDLLCGREVGDRYGASVTQAAAAPSRTRWLLHHVRAICKVTGAPSLRV